MIPGVHALCLTSIKQLDQDYLKIYDGGSEYSDLIANITGVYGQTKVGVSKNQMYIMLEMHSSDSKKAFKAIIQEIGTILKNDCIT